MVYMITMCFKKKKQEVEGVALTLPGIVQEDVGLGFVRVHTQN